MSKYFYLLFFCILFAGIAFSFPADSNFCFCKDNLFATNNDVLKGVACQVEKLMYTFFAEFLPSSCFTGEKPIKPGMEEFPLADSLSPAEVVDVPYCNLDDLSAVPQVSNWNYLEAIKSSVIKKTNDSQSVCKRKVSETQESIYHLKTKVVNITVESEGLRLYNVTDSIVVVSANNAVMPDMDQGYGDFTTFSNNSGMIENLTVQLITPQDGDKDCTNSGLNIGEYCKYISDNTIMQFKKLADGLVQGISADTRGQKKYNFSKNKKTIAINVPRQIVVDKLLPNGTDDLEATFCPANATNKIIKTGVCDYSLQQEITAQDAKEAVKEDAEICSTENSTCSTIVTDVVDSTPGFSCQLINAYRHQLLKNGDMSSYSELKDLAKEGTDFVVKTRQGNTIWLIVAPHGGIIEPGTELLADYISSRSGSALYTFKSNTQICDQGGNCRSMHITSTQFDDPKLYSFINQYKNGVIIGVHAYGSLHPGEPYPGETSEMIIVGGLNKNLKAIVASKLYAAGFNVDLRNGGPFSAMSPQNFVNKTIFGGLQIEVSRAYIRLFFEPMESECNLNPTYLANNFVDAILGSMEQYYSEVFMPANSKWS